MGGERREDELVKLYRPDLGRFGPRYYGERLAAGAVGLSASVLVAEAGGHPTNGLARAGKLVLGGSREVADSALHVAIPDGRRKPFEAGHEARHKYTDPMHAFELGCPFGIRTIPNGKRQGSSVPSDGRLLLGDGE